MLGYREGENVHGYERRAIHSFPRHAWPEERWDPSYSYSFIHEMLLEIIEVYSSSVGEDQTLLIEFDAETKNITYRIRPDNNLNILPDDFIQSFLNDPIEEETYEFDHEMPTELVNSTSDEFMVPLEFCYLRKGY